MVDAILGALGLPDIGAQRRASRHSQAAALRSAARPGRGQSLPDLSRAPLAAYPAHGSPPTPRASPPCRPQASCSRTTTPPGRGRAATASSWRRCAPAPALLQHPCAAAPRFGPRGAPACRAAPELPRPPRRRCRCLRTPTQMKRMREAGYEIGNIDSTIIAQKPKLSPHKARRAPRLSSLRSLCVGACFSADVAPSRLSPAGGDQDESLQADGRVGGRREHQGAPRSLDSVKHTPAAPPLRRAPTPRRLCANSRRRRTRRWTRSGRSAPSRAIRWCFSSRSECRRQSRPRAAAAGGGRGGMIVRIKRVKGKAAAGARVGMVLASPRASRCRCSRERWAHRSALLPLPACCVPTPTGFLLRVLRKRRPPRPSALGAGPFLRR